MEGLRKKLASRGIFAALFAIFAILASFHYHEKPTGEVSSHHCAVCHNSSSSKALAEESAKLDAPLLSFQNVEQVAASEVFVPAPTGHDPIRGPPLA